MAKELEAKKATEVGGKKRSTCAAVASTMGGGGKGKNGRVRDGEAVGGRKKVWDLMLDFYTASD